MEKTIKIKESTAEDLYTSLIIQNKELYKKIKDLKKENENLEHDIKDLTYVIYNVQQCLLEKYDKITKDYIIISDEDDFNMICTLLEVKKDEVESILYVNYETDFYDAFRIYRKTKEQPAQPINPAKFGTTEVQISGHDLFKM